jgi:predicted nucleic acid-binding protein
VDTGPLVAILSSRDEHHNACVAQLRSISPPLLTCWPVITEAIWLLRHHPAAIQRLLGSFDGGLLQLLVLEQEAISWIASFVERYRTLRAQVADAALVYLAEREGIETIFTLDRRDFSLYRLSRGRRLSLIPA